MANIWNFFETLDDRRARRETTHRGERPVLQPVPRASKPRDYSALFGNLVQGAPHAINNIAEERLRLSPPDGAAPIPAPAAGDGRVRLAPPDKSRLFAPLTGGGNDPEIQTLGGVELDERYLPQNPASQETQAVAGFYPKAERPLESVMNEIASENQSADYTADAKTIGEFYPQLQNGSVPAPKAASDRPVLSPRERWQKAENDLYDAQNKDYSIGRDELGNVVRGKDRDEDFDWKDRLVPGLLGALAGLMRGGIGGAAGGAIAGLIGAQFDRNLTEKMRANLFEIPRLQQQAEASRNAYETNLKMVGAENDETRKWNEEARRTEKALNDSYEALMKQLVEDGVFDEKDAEIYEQVTGRRLAPFDKRGYEIEMREGKSYQRPKTGGGPFTETNLPTERVKQPLGVNVENPDGSTLPVPMLPKDAANFQYRSQTDKAKAEARQEEAQRREQFTADRMNFKSVADWRKARTKAQGEIAGYQKSIAQLNQSIAEVDAQINQYKGNYDVSDLLKTKQNLEKQRAAFEAKTAEAEAVLNSPRPDAFKPSQRKNSRRGNYTSTDIDRIIRQ
jgi:hypothetical protein